MHTPSTSAVRTNDVRRAGAHLGEAFPAMTIRFAPGSGPFRFEHRVVSDGRLAVHRLRCTGVLEMTGGMPGAVASGRSRSAGPVRFGDQPVTTALPYLRPTGPSTLHAVDADLTLIAFEAERLSGFLERSSLAAVPVERGPRSTARSVLGLVMDQLLVVTADEAPGLDDQVFEAAAWSVGQAFEDPFAAAGPEIRAVRPRALRRAMALAEAPGEGPLSIEELAAAAGTSVRTLQVLFRRELDTTPHRYLREVRLDRARAELLADPAPPVMEVAQRWGFVNLGRFAAYYRDRFGENPAATRRRDVG